MKKRNLKKLILSLLIGCVAFGTVATATACGGFGGGNGGNEIESLIDKLDIKYNEDTQCVTWINDGLVEKVKIRINATDYEVHEDYFFVGKLGLKHGIYACYIEVSYNGEVLKHQIEVRYGGEKGGYHVHFHDYDDSYVKTLFFDVEEYFLTEEDLVPLPKNTEGVSYTYNYKVGEFIPSGEQIRIIPNYAEYSISYELNGGSLSKVFYVAHSYFANNPIYIPAATRTGYVFGGWYDNPDFKGEPIYCWGENGETGDVTFYAKWDEMTEDARALFDAIAETKKAKTFTFINGELERGCDITDGYYRHEIWRGKLIEVVLDGYRYEVENKVRFPYTENFSLITFYNLGVLDQCVKNIRYEGDGRYRVDAKEITKGYGEMVITVADGKIVKMEGWGDQETVEIYYYCEKVDIDESEYREERCLNVTVLVDGIEKGSYSYNIEHEDGEAEIPIYDEILWHIKEGEYKALGYFSDRECTKPITTFKEVEGQVYFACESSEYIAMKMNFTLQFTCQCSTCNGKTHKYEMSVDDLASYMYNPYAIEDEHLRCLFVGGLVEHGKGYSLSSVYAKKYYYYGSHNQEGEYHFDMNMIPNFLSELARNSEEKVETYTFELFNKRVSADNVLAKVVINGTVNNIYVPFHEKEEMPEDDYRYSVALSYDTVLSYIPDGYCLVDLYEDDKYTTPFSSMMKSRKEEFYVYAKTVKDTRKTIRIHLGFQGGFRFTYSRLNQNQPVYRDFTDPISVKVFADENAYEAFTYVEVWDGVIYGDGHIFERNYLTVTGCYLDANYTKPITRDMDFSQITDVYLKTGGEEVTYTLHFVDGSSITRTDKVGTPLINLYPDLSGYRTDEYRSVEKFYSDANRTNEIVSVKAGDIYVGYKKHPKITFVCPSGCVAKEHTIYAVNDYLELYIFGHYITQGNHNYQITFYTDKEYTQMANKDHHITEDITLYGKVEGMEKDYRVHCGCLVHGNTGFSVTGYNAYAVVEAYMEEYCNYGKDISYHTYYADSARTKRASLYENTTEFWLEERTLVYIHADYSGLRSDNKVLVEDFYEVFKFNERYGEAGTTTRYCLYTDSSLSKPWLARMDQTITAGQHFYFKKVSGSFSVTIKADLGGEDGMQEYMNSYSGATASNTVGFSSDYFDGKKIVALYYDSALTNLAIDAGELVYLNDSITLYAKVIDMPRLTVIYYDEYETEYIEEFNLYNFDDMYVNYIHSLLYRDCEDGYMWELCKYEDGSGAVDLCATAKEGTYYLVKNLATKNNYKFTINNLSYSKDRDIYREVELDDSIRGSVRVGKGNIFYLPRTSTITGETIYSMIANSGVYYENGMGQQFHLGMTEAGIPLSDMFTVYTNSAMTTKLALTTKLTSNTNFYVKYNTSKLKRVTIDLEDGNSVYFEYLPDTDIAYGGANVFFDIVNGRGNMTSILYEKYPKFLQYGAIDKVYLDSARTEEVSWLTADTMPSKLYATLTEVYAYTIYNGNEIISQGASKTPYTFKSILRNLQNYVEFRPGYTPYLSTTRDGKDEMTESMQMQGVYYVCYKRSEQAEITVVCCDCEYPTMHQNVLYYNLGDSSSGETYLGTYEKFYLNVGSTKLKAILKHISNMVHNLMIEGEAQKELTVKFYSDSACTKEITDFTVAGDCTIYVKVIK